MRIRAVLSVVVLACSMSGCTSGSKPAAKPRVTASAGEVAGKAEQTPLKFGAKPLWTDRTKGVPPYADQFALHGDRVIAVSGPKGGEADRLSAMDAATGMVRWSVKIWTPLKGGHGDRWDGLGPFDPAPQVVDRSGGWGVLIRTSQNHSATQPAYGLALLSGEDGHVLWRAPLVAERKSDHDVYPDLLLSDGKLAVTSLRPSGNATMAGVRLVAVDTRTGKRLWSRSGMRLRGIVGGSVIAAAWRNPAAISLDATPTGAVTILDAATGSARWSLRDRMTDATAVAAVNGLVLVRELQGGRLLTPILLDLATGAELGRMPDQTGNCADDRTRLIVCEALSPEPRLFTIRAGERKARTVARRPPDGTPALVRDGRIYYSDLDGPGQEMDPSGIPLVAALPAGLLGALSDKYAVFRSPEDQRYQVYRVG